MLSQITIYNSNPLFIAIFIFLFILLLIDKDISIFYIEKKSKKFLVHEWLTYLPTATYFLISLFGVLEIFLNSRILDLRLSSFGIVLLTVGFILRRSAINALGDNWNIYVSSKFAKKIVSKGTYKHNRHPYYWGSIFELIGFLAIPNSFLALFFAALIQLPLYILRIIFEEKDLIKKFGLKYVAYQKKTFIFFPGENSFALRIMSIKRYFHQLINLIQLLGFKHLLKIAKVHGHMLVYARNFMISHCFSALLNIAFLDEIIKKEFVNIDTFCCGKDINRKYLKAICEYLYAIKIFSKVGVNSFGIEKRGKELYQLSQGVFNLLHAYAPLFFDLESLLKNKRIYGKDVHRREWFVARGSAGITQYLPFPAVKQMIRKYNIKTILDIGCGNGEFLASIYNSNGNVCYGIDSSPEAIACARENIESSNLDSKISFYIYDMFDIEKIKNKFKHIDALSFMFVLHEFLPKGKEKIIQLLSKYHNFFPNSYLIVCELCKQSTEYLRKRTTAIAEHHLFHHLSNQGIITFNEWRKVFSKSGLEVIEAKRFDFAEQGYFVLK